MILTREVDIKVTDSNYQYLIDMGYDIIMGEMVTIPIELLSKGSQHKILCKCDLCGIEKKVIFKNYLKYKVGWGEYKCRKCSEPIRKIALQENYGCDFPLQNIDIKTKAIINRQK